MSVINFGFDADKKIAALTLRVTELEARQARMEKALSRQRRVNEALLGLMENVAWGDWQAALDKSQAIE
jgi:hypothetical protein